MEKSIEDVTARASDHPVEIRPVWNADTCPAELLPWLAWALSIDTWRPYWSEATKRQRIRDAIAIQRRKGTARAVLDAVAALDPNVTIREWWQAEPRGVPHSFEVILPETQQADTETYTRDIFSEVSRTKPVRSQFAVTTERSVTGALGILGAVRVVTFRRLGCIEA
ncbi:phage tail protein I [Marinobacterium sp. OS208]|nr:phage tail protein I [Marinobacterium sedimentorum]